MQWLVNPCWLWYVLESGTDPLDLYGHTRLTDGSLSWFSRHCSMVWQSSYIHLWSDSNDNLWSSKYGQCVIHNPNLDDYHIELRSGDDSEHASKLSKSRWSRFYKLMLLSSTNLISRTWSLRMSHSVNCVSCAYSVSMDSPFRFQSCHSTWQKACRCYKLLLQLGMHAHLGTCQGRFSFELQGFAL